MKKGVLLVFLLFSAITSCAVLSYGKRIRDSIALADFGLNEVTTSEQLFWVLYNAHLTALKEGLTVDYSGIDTLRVEIPKKAKSIPLTMNNDFKGVVFIVTNETKDFFLFEYENESTSIIVNKADIDNGKFKKYKGLRKGKHLLYVKDRNPWVENREGYKYGHIREDIILVAQGNGANKPVMPYNNNYSDPECKYYDVDGNGFHFENLEFHRTQECTYKTFLCRIKGVEGLIIDNVIVTTPENNWGDDRVIVLEDCANVTFNKLTIKGTYSRKDYSGYGIQMKNIWNFQANNMYGHGNWGVFGTNNINFAHITNSDINRFDIHCYGRDVFFDNVTFRERYNQFSSVYGTIEFDNCNFINFVPIINGTSYNAYVGYDVVFNNCEYTTEHDTPLFIECGYIDDVVNNRHELSNRSLPNIMINNVTLRIPQKAPNIYLFFFLEKGGKKRIIDYISYVSINGLKVDYKGDGNRTPANFLISNIHFEKKEKVKEKYENIDILGNSKRKSDRKGLILNYLK